MSKRSAGLGDVILTGKQFRALNDEIERLRTALESISKMGAYSADNASRMRRVAYEGLAETGAISDEE